MPGKHSPIAPAVPRTRACRARAASREIASRNLSPRSAGTFGRPHAHQQLLRPPQALILVVASRAIRQVLLQREHLRARHRSIQIWREQPLRLGAPQSQNFPCALHGITSTLLPPPATCDRNSAVPMFVMMSFAVRHRSGQSQFITNFAHVGRQPLPQCVSAARQPRFHRSQRNLQDLGNLFVRHFFQIAQNERRAIGFRHVPQLFFHSVLHFVMRDTFKRRIRMIGQRHLHRVFARARPVRIPPAQSRSLAPCAGTTIAAGLPPRAARCGRSTSSGSTRRENASCRETLSERRLALYRPRPPDRSRCGRPAHTPAAETRRSARHMPSSEPAFSSATIAASSCERAPIALARSPKVVAPAILASPDYRIFHPTAPLKIYCLAKSGKL